MPPTRRRVINTTAAAKKLPTSRLPLGTPPLPLEDFRTHSRASRRSSGDALESHLASSDADTPFSPNAFTPPLKKDNGVPLAPASHNSITDISKMPKRTSRDDGPPVPTLAEVKLQRQNERIRQAEAALTVPSVPDVQHSSSRGGRSKHGRNSDSGDSLHHALEKPTGPADTVRVNRFRAHSKNRSRGSRGSSLARSVSSLSHTNSTTDARELDTAHLPNSAGFTVITGRRSRRPPTTLHGDKAGESNATVEAVADEREILEVFGSSLPSLTYIEQSVGSTAGQLQFVQHPNGDVSAHMWSVERFQWENVGQFSNIRKRIEGQLAGNRLKGETGTQTLQQNTLAYFRTIAKQREADAMGLPFGPKEVHALLSGTHSPAKTVPENKARTVPSRVEVPSSVSRSLMNSSSEPAIAAPSEPRALRRAFPPALPDPQHLPIPAYPRQPRASSSTQPASMRANQSMSKSDDPFLSHESYSTRVPGTSSSAQPSSTLSLPIRSTTRQSNVGSAVSGELLRHQSSASQQNPHINQTQGVPPFTSAEFPGLLPVKQTSPSRALAPTASSHLHRVSSGLEMPPKPETPSSRAAMREHLVKLGEIAAERSAERGTVKSGARTVLRDPYREQTTQPTQDTDAESSKTAPESPTSSKISPKTSLDPSRMRPFLDASRLIMDTSNLPNHRSHTSDGAGKSPLNGSVPDTNEHGVNSSRSRSLYHESSPFASGASYSSGSSSPHSMPHDEALLNWWNGGKKFARQQDFFQSIKSAHRLTSSRSSAVPSMTASGMIRPPTTGPFAFPIDNGSNTPGTSSSQQQQRSSATSSSPPPFNEGLTRILIPIYENLAAYTEKRKDYWCQWVDPPPWALDRTPNGHSSFYDERGQWGQPPARIGRDPRYSWSARMQLDVASPSLAAGVSLPSIYHSGRAIPTASQQAYVNTLTNYGPIPGPSNCGLSGAKMASPAGSSSSAPTTRSLAGSNMSGRFSGA